MKAEKHILEKSVKALKNSPFPSGPDRQTLDATLAALSQASGQKYEIPNKKQTILERIKFMKSYAKLAVAAAVMIGAVGLFIGLFHNGAAPAYALEQTIQACHSIRYIHIKDFSKENNEPKEFWLEFDELGKVKNIRAHMPEWDSPSDGAKEIVWNEGKAKVWFKKKNALLVVNEQRFANQLLAIAMELDPKLAAQRYQELEKQGKVKIEVNEPATKTEPIVITATSSNESREVLLIDQATKLVVEIDRYISENGAYKLIGRTELWDYNQQIDSKMFTLENLPADVMRVDQTTQDVGLVQGQLSKEQIAQEVARQFFEALIAADYDKAGKLLEGMPADSVRKIVGNTKVHRVISIGPAAQHPNPATGGLVVPSIIEIERDGKIIERRFDRLGVRPVYNQPNRWTIFGGIESFDPNIPNDYKSADEPKSPSVEQKLGRELTEAEKIEQPKVKEMVEKFFQAWTNSDWDGFTKLFPGAKLDERKKILLQSIQPYITAEPYKKDSTAIWYVPYQFRQEGKKRTLRVCYDQESNGFIVRGGI